MGVGDSSGETDPATRSISVARLLETAPPALELEVLTGADVSLERRIATADVSSPGLTLAGHAVGLDRARSLVFGEAETSYLATLGADVVGERLAAVLSESVAIAFVTRSRPVSERFLAAARAASVPVLGTPLASAELKRALKARLEDALAPATSVHGALADVYGIGLLFTGPSGIGKSECVLGLVKNGHRLVADDVVLVSRRGGDVLVGRGHERSRFHMEIRGVGIVDVASMYGVRATRQRKRVEVIVDLRAWDDVQDVDRTGLDRESVRILGVDLPKLVIPLNPGKSLIAVSEVIAMNQLLAYSGVDAPARFDARLRRSMNPPGSLAEDYE